MSTKLPLLYSVFGLAGTGGEGDPLCRSGSARPPLGSLSHLQEESEGVHRVGQGEAELPYPVQVADSPPTVRRGTRIRNKTDIYQAGLD